VASSGTGAPVLTGYIYNAEGERVSKGSITVWSCDPGTNGFKPLSDYIVGRSGEQVTEMGMDPSGSMAWQHTNVYALGKVMATYDNDGGKGGQPPSVHETSVHETSIGGSSPGCDSLLLAERSWRQILLSVSGELATQSK
jgi:hypothetical protein